MPLTTKVTDDTVDARKSGDSGSITGNHLPPSAPGEVWKDIVGYEGLYQVSNQSRVWSVPRRDRRGRLWGGNLRCLGVDNNTGYHVVALSQDGKPRTSKVHRLVAEAFLGTRPDGTEVCHGPGESADDSVCDWAENLSY